MRPHKQILWIEEKDEYINSAGLQARDQVKGLQNSLFELNWILKWRESERIKWFVTNFTKKKKKNLMIIQMFHGGLLTATHFFSFFSLIFHFDSLAG